MKTSTPFTSYSALDLRIARCSGIYRMPLLGGTALEVLAWQYGVAAPRVRSVNDFDLLWIDGHSLPLERLDERLSKLGLSRGRGELTDPHLAYHGQDFRGRPVEVDVLRTFDGSLAGQAITCGALYLLNPRAQARMKQERLQSPIIGTSSERLDLDRSDIRWLLALPGRPLKSPGSASEAESLSGTDLVGV